MGSFVKRNLSPIVLLILCLATGLTMLRPPGSIDRVLTTLVFLYVAPGHALLTAIMPKRTQENLLLRIFGSVGLSVVVVGLITLIQTYFAGISQRLVFWSITIWIVLLGGSAILSRERLYGRIAGNICDDISFPAAEIKERMRGGSMLIQLLVLVLILISAARLWLVSDQRKPEYTEFYIAGLDGTLGRYPEDVQMGIPLALRVGIDNQRRRDMRYELCYRVDDNPCTHLKTLELAGGAAIETLVYPTVNVPGKDHRLTLELRNPDQKQTVDSLHIWVDVET